MAAIIKICGLKDAETAIAAAAAGATHLGFVFFTKSPRHLDAATAEDIVTEVKQAADAEGFVLPGFVGLFVDGGESALAEVAHFLTHFQFHGHESPERCAAVRGAFGVELIKAVGVGSADDIVRAQEFADAADLVLFDARPPKGSDRPGGHGRVFDFATARAWVRETPFLLAGGLSPDNVGAAIAAVGGHPAFAGVDVSSGVERAAGRKDEALIAAFVAAARRSFASAGE